MEHNRALIIGIGADLSMTVTDAKGIASILSDPARCGFDPANVRTLTEADAFRDAIVCFFGHGYLAKISIGKSTFLMPYGHDLADLSETAISGRKLRRLSGYTCAVNSAAYSREGRQIVTASNDKTAQIWIAGIDELRPKPRA